MGGTAFDRKAYIRPEEVDPAPPPPSSLPGRLIIFLAIIAVAAAGYALHKIIGSSSPSEAGTNYAEFAQIAMRLDALEHRLDAMEEKMRASKARPAPDTGKQEPEKTAPPPSAPVAQPHFVVSPAPKPQSVPLGPPQPSLDISALRQEREKALSSLRSDVVAAREEWTATADRLGNVVGELNSQRQEIARNQESLEQLKEHFQRNSVAFTLQKDGSKQQVGPVRMLLESTDTKNSRYTMRLLFEDQWTELKDRALQEAVQFYAPDGEVALELIVSRISKNAVVGRLALPPTNASP